MLCGRQAPDTERPEFNGAGWVYGCRAGTCPEEPAEQLGLGLPEQELAGEVGSAMHWPHGHAICSSEQVRAHPPPSAATSPPPLLKLSRQLA